MFTYTFIIVHIPRLTIMQLQLNSLHIFLVTDYHAWSFWPTKQHLRLLWENTRLINHATHHCIVHCIICFISFQSKARQLPVFHLYESLILANILERCSSRISATVKMSWKRRKIVVDNTSYIIRFSYIWIKYTHNTELFYLEYRHAIHFLYAMTHFHQ